MGGEGATAAHWATNGVGPRHTRCTNHGRAYRQEGNATSLPHHTPAIGSQLKTFGANDGVDRISRSVVSVDDPDCLLRSLNGQTGIHHRLRHLTDPIEHIGVRRPPVPANQIVDIVGDDKQGATWSHS